MVSAPQHCAYAGHCSRLPRSAVHASSAWQISGRPAGHHDSAGQWEEDGLS